MSDPTKPSPKERQSPKQELIETLDAIHLLLVRVENPRMTIAQLAGLVEHARGLAQRVGETSRPRVKKEKGATT